MAQISLYIDDVTAARLNTVAKARSISVSKYVAALISGSLSNEDAEEARKKQLLSELQGAIIDLTIVEPPEILMVAENQRRYDML